MADTVCAVDSYNSHISVLDDHLLSYSTCHDKLTMNRNNLRLLRH